jgi:hypothetical protein
VQERLAKLGCETWPDTFPDAAGALVRAEITRRTPVAAATNL